MSLLNAWTSDDQAIIAVDTDGAAADGERLPTSKLLTIPHLGVVLALRGQAVFFHYVYLHCLSGGFDTFDQLDDALPDILADVDMKVPRALLTENAPAGNVLVVVGWSDRNNAITGRQFVKRDDMAEFSASDFGMHIAPWHESMPDIEKIPANVEEIARAQVAWMRSEFGPTSCGGRLLLTRIKKCSITTEGLNVL